MSFPGNQFLLPCTFFIQLFVGYYIYAFECAIELGNPRPTLLDCDRSYNVPGAIAIGIVVFVCVRACVCVNINMISWHIVTNRKVFNFSNIFFYLHSNILCCSCVLVFPF